MGLADLKKKKEQPQGLAALKNREPKPKGLAALKSKALEKPAGLAALKAKRNPSLPHNKGGEKGLAGFKKKRDLSMKLNAKQDFIRGGFKFHNCRFVPRDMEPICYNGAPGAFWSVDVTNGTETATFHNRWGSWFSGGWDHDDDRTPLPGFDPNAKGAREPFAFWVQNAIQDRYVAELKARKLPGMGELRRKREEEEKETRRREEEKRKLAELRESRRLKKLEASKRKAKIK